MAKKRLPRAIFDFFDGGAEDEMALRANQSAYGDMKLLPRALVDVSKVDLATSLLGGPSKLPLAVGPTGAAGYGWRDGDIAIARAAAAAGVPYGLSTTATASIEDIASKAGGRLWFQAYIFRRRAFTFELIARAKACDYEAVMITVDLPVGGKRERDFRNDFALPFRYTPRNLLDFARNPRWALGMLAHGLPAMSNLVGLEQQQSQDAVQMASSVGRNYDPSFDWDGLAAIRDAWPRKLIVKGIMRPEDTARLAAMGCDAVVVSNHGGRQLDASPGTFHALANVVAAAGSMEVLLDGGIRRGSDIVKALALGAKGVLIGRATLYGACAAGEPGARQAISILGEELQRTMQLCGLQNILRIGPDAIAPA